MKQIRNQEKENQKEIKKKNKRAPGTISAQDRS
jgi:hypothetical protein